MGWDCSDICPGFLIDLRRRRQPAVSSDLHSLTLPGMVEEGLRRSASERTAARDSRTDVRAGTKEWLRRGPN
jgi:hypothetical protein